MTIIKRTKDHFVKFLLGSSVVPRGLFDSREYFRIFGSINFEHKEGVDGHIIARSTNFRYGSIVTSGRDTDELDKNIRDAILTSFSIPSSYAAEAKIHKAVEGQEEYAIA